MYSSNIAAWVVNTLTAVIAVGIAAPILSIYTYGPHKWASTNASNIVPMTKETQSSLYNVIEYNALERFMSNAGGNYPFPPDVCTHKSFNFTYTIIPVYEGNELIPREFVIDMFASDGYAKHIILSNGVPGKTIDYRTGTIN